MHPSSSYSSIDSTIQEWANANSLKMFTVFAGREERFCYIANSRGECFQISIQPPLDAVVTVDAWTVETLDDDELHERWVVSMPQLRMTLDAALNKVNEWFVRGR